MIVEYGFLDSTGDDVNQIKNNYENLAEAVVKALAEYIGVPYSVKGTNYYIVKKGDSLWSIAKKYNTTVDSLKSINNLSTNNLSIGQKLLLPGNEQKQNDDVYIVKSGDTLYKIANNFNIAISDLKSINNLKSDLLSIGQKLLIPTSIYTVKSGDTLYALAKKFNTTVDKLKNINNLSTNNLSIGQKLKIK